MLGDLQLAEVRKMFSADSPIVNLAREEIQGTISSLLDLSGIDMPETLPAEQIALEAKARKLAAEKVREIFTHLGFELRESAKEDRKKSFR